jgi:hypothetical protein
LYQIISLFEKKLYQIISRFTISMKLSAVASLFPKSLCSDVVAVTGGAMSGVGPPHHLLPCRPSIRLDFRVWCFGGWHMLIGTCIVVSAAATVAVRVSMFFSCSGWRRCDWYLRRYVFRSNPDCVVSRLMGSIWFNLHRLLHGGGRRLS